MDCIYAHSVSGPMIKETGSGNLSDHEAVNTMNHHFLSREQLELQGFADLTLARTCVSTIRA